ncbi:NADH-dependent flavin oxidoreductase [Caryophanon tenue]|uniref:NADH-dependent flavin oxidoreductase n=1 Tax=Caryophanon tenue TaxID=33978 RepID=A0A1C0YD81_9BACL|nr:NADH-dependent flavin oxidoreductase [Caryophanon tenue]OCS85132.1 NADH-dependent flavin oxidoreductase [Caryophanon tenue]
MTTTTLFETYTLPNEVTLRNRFVMAPMTTYSGNDDGTVSEQELTYYTERSYGVGMLITACAYVAPNGKAFPGQISADDDKYIDSLRAIAEAIRVGGAKSILQIHHGGRKSVSKLVPNGDVVGAGDEDGVRALTTEEVDGLVDAYAQATRRAIEAGFDGVEIHGANTYLIQQFFSGFTNKRTDKYGGSLEKRLTFPTAITEAVLRVKEQYATPAFIVGYRFSPEEPEEDGITMDDTEVLINALLTYPLDYIHVSLGDYRSTTHRYTKGEGVNRLEALQRIVNGRVPLIGVGSIYMLEEAQEAAKYGSDLIALGRALLIEPHWVEKVAAGEAVETQMDEHAPRVMPDNLMQVIKRNRGWIPGV